MGQSKESGNDGWQQQLQTKLFFFSFYDRLHPRAFPSSCFHSPTEQKKKKKQNTDDPCFSKARINGRQKYTKANYKTWHGHAHSALLHATRGRFRADQSASMIAVANKHGVGGGMCTSAGSRGIERSVTYKKTVVESFIAFMLRSVFQGSNWAATSPVLKLWEVSRSFIINLTQFTLVGEAGKKKFIGRMCARARDETGGEDSQTASSVRYLTSGMTFFEGHVPPPPSSLPLRSGPRMSRGECSRTEAGPIRPDKAMPECNIVTMAEELRRRYLHVTRPEGRESERCTLCLQPRCRGKPIH